MKITPVAAPVGESLTTSWEAGGNAAKARAMAAFNQAQNAQPMPSVNPSNVSVEEIGAVKSNNLIQPDSKVDQAPSEPKPTLEATKTEEDQPLSTQFAILARKEKALRAKALAQEQTMKAREDALKAREESLRFKDSEYESKYVPKERLARELPQVLSELGMSSEQITQLLLNAPTQQDLQSTQLIKTLEDKIAKLEADQAASKKSYEDTQIENRRQVVNQIRSEVSQLVRSGDEYETIRESNSVEDVVDLIQKTFDRDGILLSAEEAAREVEDYLVDNMVNTYQKLNKIKQRLAPKEPTAPKQETQAKPTSPEHKQQITMKTLTNSVSSNRPLTNKERAILAFNNKLKE